MSSTHTTLNLKDQLHVDKKLEKIWSGYYNEDHEPISGLFPAELVKNAVTFLSLNPSLLPKDYQKANRGYYPAVPYPLIDCFAAKADYGFFQKFYDLGDKIKPWTIIDLLYIRESKQHELKAKFDSKFTSEKDKTFLINQMKLTFEIIIELNPKVVVVSNGFSDRLIHKFLKELNLKEELPIEENGWIYRINGIPFITNESRFLGSRIHSRNDERRKKLADEIIRVLEHSKV